MGARESGTKAWLADAQKAIADFLEGVPLYTAFTVELVEAVTVDDIAPRAFSRWCPACRSSTTWRATDSSGFRYGSPTFKCAQCESASVHFRLQIEPDPYAPQHPAAMSISPNSPPRPLTDSKKWTFRKWGQRPAWSITPAPEIRDALGAEDLELYKKALVCASQSYGIGALAYFRRVVENSINAMLDLVHEAATADGDEDALRNVQRARESKRTEEKLALIVEHVPPTLRPGGANPLAVLHDRYSKGLHALSDEECVRIALELRKAFDFVFRNLRQLAREAKEYADEMKALASQVKKPGDK